MILQNHFRSIAIALCLGSWILFSSLDWPFREDHFSVMASPQIEKDKKPPAKPVASKGSILVIESDGEYEQYLAAVSDCIKDKVWTDATRALAVILADEEDRLVRVSEYDPALKKTFPKWASAKNAARKLFFTIPPQHLKPFKTLLEKKATPAPMKLKGTITAVLADISQLKSMEKNRAYVLITPQSKLWKQVGNQKKIIKAAEIFAGEEVECTLDNPVLGPKLFPVPASDVRIKKTPGNQLLLPLQPAVEPLIRHLPRLVGEIVFGGRIGRG